MRLSQNSETMAQPFIESIDTVSTEEALIWLKKRNFDPDDICRLRRRSRQSTSFHSECPHPLLDACELGDLKICNWLLLNGASSMLSTPSNHNWTPLSK